MAVYTEVADDELEAFLSAYDLGALLSFKGIAEGVENSNFLLRTEAGAYILTLYEKRVAAADLPFFLGLMEHLAERGITCPLPVHGRDGEALRPTRRAAGRDRHVPRRHVGAAAADAALRGGRRRRSPSCTRPARTFRCSAPNALSRRRLAAALSRCRATAPTRVEPGLRRVDRRTSSRSSRRPGRTACRTASSTPTSSPTTSSSWQDRLSGLIDFYFACNDLLAYDLAVCLNAWCFEPRQRLQRHQGPGAAAGLRERAAARAGRARGAAGARARRGAALPADAALRLADRAGRRAGHAEGPARISAQAALPPEGREAPPTTGCAHERRAEARRHLHRRRLLRQSRARAAGARSCASTGTEKELSGGEPRHHQQPHGADGGDRGARGAEAAVRRRAAHRLRICAERHHRVDPRLEARTAGRPPTRSR